MRTTRIAGVFGAILLLVCGNAQQAHAAAITSARHVVRKTLVALALLASAQAANAVPLLAENFDDITSLGLSGWAAVNNSTAGGSTGWFQGNTGVFDSQSGAPDSYVAANFLNAGFAGDISNWLITPEFSLGSAATVSFYTRGSGFLADRLELRASQSGSSTDVGTTASSVGAFATLILSLNPTLADTGYPTAWTGFALNVSGIFEPGAVGRLAFRYFVTDTSVNGDYIGIDSLVVDPLAVPEPWTPTLLMTGLLGLLLVRRPRHG